MSMRQRHFGEAEITWVSSLASFEGAGPGDARVDTTLSNLVRLASVYHRLDRQAEADRVMSIVVDYVSQLTRVSRRAAYYTARYQRQSQETLEEIYRPRRELEDGGRDREPKLTSLIRRAARKFQVDPHLVKAVVAVESNFDVLAESEKGAQGLMQLMPATAREMGIHSPFEPSENLRGGVRYLRSLLDRYSEVEIALAAYNAGPVAVDRYGGVPPFPETEAYVKRVLKQYREYRDEVTQ